MNAILISQTICAEYFQMGDQLQREFLRTEEEIFKLGSLQHVLTQWRKEDKFNSTPK